LLYTPKLTANDPGNASLDENMQQVREEESDRSIDAENAENTGPLHGNDSLRDFDGQVHDAQSHDSELLAGLYGN